MFRPNFQITPEISKALMEIEAVRQAVIELPFDVEMLRSLRETAKLLATHHSTQIEGNRLTQAQVAEAVSGAITGGKSGGKSGGHFPGRERDEAEVRNYYNAIADVERLADQTGNITEADLQRLHGISFNGGAIQTPYRDSQNVIRDGASGSIVYMPPKQRMYPNS
jgi:Fic family protein